MGSLFRGLSPSSPDVSLGRSLLGTGLSAPTGWSGAHSLARCLVPRRVAGVERRDNARRLRCSVTDSARGGRPRCLSCARTLKPGFHAQVEGLWA